MRYLPLTKDDRAEMMARIGIPAVDDLFADIPADKRAVDLPRLPLAQGELEVERALARLAAKNVAAGTVPFFVGAGAYRHHVPASVDHLIQRSEFLTSYTPYQPEIAQGTLQYLFEFQTQVAELTQMEVANASMYDGSTATAEAVLMAHRLTRRSKAVLAGNLHPHYRATVQTLSRYAGDIAMALDPVPAGGEALIDAIDETCSCIVVQSPDVFGNLVDLRPIAEAAHAKGALLIAVFTEAVSLGLLEPAGAQGADIVVGEGQSIGNALNFGGPYVGLFATRTKFIRQMPGRLAGETVDAEGRRGFVLTLSTREQHIRREKATSNICTNSGLCALAFTIHMSLLGREGLTRLARLNHMAACDLADRLGSVPGVEVLNAAFFNEFTIRVPGVAADVVEKLAEKGVLGGVPYARLAPDAGLDDLILVAATETTTDEDRAAFAAALKEVLAGPALPVVELGTALEHALNRAARWMATYQNPIDDGTDPLAERVSAGLDEVLISEGFLDQLLRGHHDKINDYCEYYFSVGASDLTSDRIDHIVKLSDDGTNDERFNRLYDIAREIRS